MTLQRNGAQSVSGTTNASGSVNLGSTFADDQDALLIVKKEGYSNLVVKCLCAGMTYAISPVMTSLDGMRVVLSWGEKPFDLDSHLIFPGGHIYFDSKEGTDANLDVDDTDSYGPETVTISKKHFGESYIYAVQDYSNKGLPNSNYLSASKAKVFVYVGSSWYVVIVSLLENEGTSGPCLNSIQTASLKISTLLPAPILTTPH